MKKIANWLFRKDLDLNKKWWHRFIKVSYFLILGIITVGFLVVIFIEPYNDYFLSHNVNKTTLNSFSKNYTGKDSDNILYKFIETRKDFGILENGTLKDNNLYLSKYSFDDDSFCLKEPLKYIEWIKKIITEKAEKEAKATANINRELTLKEREELENKLQKVFEDDTERKCLLFTNDSELKDVGENRIAILEPNTFYYFELVIGLFVTSFLGWVIPALVYYKLVLYIIFGSKK